MNLHYFFGIWRAPHMMILNSFTNLKKMEIEAVEGQERFEFCVTICVLLSIHDDLPAPLECQCSRKHRIQINHHKKVLLRQLILNNINIEFSLQKNDEDKGERLYQNAFYIPKRPTETYFHLFSPCCVT